MDVSPFGALFAGLLSFLSPCVLPLVPAYLAVLTAGGEGRWRAVWRAALFILGFTSVFILLGLAASTLGGLLRAHRPLLGRIGGVAVILLGLHQLGILRLAPLYRERRLGMPSGGSAPAALVIGMVFALGWTPCLGPVLGSILMLAGVKGGALQGAILLAAYSLGLALPFLAAALSLDTLRNRLRVLVRYTRYFEMAGGILLVILGLLLACGWLGILARF